MGFCHTAVLIPIALRCMFRKIPCLDFRWDSHVVSWRSFPECSAEGFLFYNQRVAIPVTVLFAFGNPCVERVSSHGDGT